MKRNAFVLFAALSLAMLHTRAQGIHLGIKAGANLFKVDGQSFSSEYKFGYNIGAFSEINFTPNLGIQPELLFNQTNYRTGTQFADLYNGGINNYEGKLRYLSIPVLLNIRPIPLLSILVGPQFGILLNKDEHLTYQAKQAFKSGDLSIVGGAQLNLASLKVGARYVIGLNNINDVDDQSSWKNQGWQLYAGFRIF
ncbi:MAG TPA: porin family protein [Puia sp.]|uniref:porin family protein n=1 Tax=Puia sp. TaxID=2045100 RepID=UPI002CC35111|nr:porin family protein [Puia sp.]HVU96592.1 porin family protein [Puia sp.]